MPVDHDPFAEQESQWVMNSSSSTEGTSRRRAQGPARSAGGTERRGASGAVTVHGHDAGMREIDKTDAGDPHD